MPRQFFFGGNWKSNGSLESITTLAEGLRAAAVHESSQVVVAPIALHLETVKRILEGSSIMVAAQNASRTGEGAFTGEISAEALRDFGINWVILGHSERRQYYGDDDQIVADKIAKCLSENLNVIACIGETLEERKAEKTMEVVSRQLEAIRLKVNSWENIVIAYEPVWAIGTGLTATPEQAQQTHAAIRQWLSEKVSPAVAASVRIIYGGSVKPANCVELIEQADIDGFLVGGASLKADLFLPIVNSPQSASRL